MELVGLRICGLMGFRDLRGCWGLGVYARYPGFQGLGLEVYIPIGQGLGLEVYIPVGLGVSGISAHSWPCA